MLEIVLLFVRRANMDRQAELSVALDQLDLVGLKETIFRETNLIFWFWYSKSYHTNQKIKFDGKIK